MTDINRLPIPKDMRKKFAAFLDLFIEYNGPGPEPTTEEPPLSSEERVELIMFDMFLKGRQLPEWLRRRIKRRYIEEEFLMRRKEAFDIFRVAVGPMYWTWVCRFCAVYILVTTIGFWRSSPAGEFPAYMVLIGVIASALFFWWGEKRKR
jgi:hypothetical protein